MCYSFHHWELAVANQSVIQANWCTVQVHWSAKLKMEITYTMHVFTHKICYSSVQSVRYSRSAVTYSHLPLILWNIHVLCHTLHVLIPSNTVILTVMGDFIKYSTINKKITLVMQNHSPQQIKQINWTTRNHLMGLQNHLMAQRETRNHFVRPQMNH